MGLAVVGVGLDVTSRVVVTEDECHCFERFRQPCLFTTSLVHLIRCLVLLPDGEDSAFYAYLRRGEYQENARGSLARQAEGISRMKRDIYNEGNANTRCRT